MKYSVLVSALVLSAAVKGKEMEEVSVTASPLEKNRDAISQAVGILSGDELRQEAAATIGETLSNQLGVSSAGFGPGVGLPVIRGQSANRVRVMQDSIGTLDVSSASPDHAVAIEPLQAQRIEVLRGPATLRYGSGAIGGVVNVIDNRIPDKVPDGLEGAVELRHATVNDENAGVFTLDGGAPGIAWHMDGLYRDSNDLEIEGLAALNVDDASETTDGFIVNTNTQTRGGTVGISRLGEKGFIGFSVSHVENNYGIPPGAHAEDDEETPVVEESGDEFVRINLRQTRYDLKGELKTPFTGFEKLTFRVGYNDYQHQELEGGMPGTLFSSDALEGRIELVHSPFKGWHGAVGLQLLDQDFSAIGEEAIIPKSQIRNYGVFFVEEYRRDSWIYEVGARIDEQRIEPISEQVVDHTSLSASASAQWHFSTHQSLGLILSRAQRPPAVEELFSFGPHLATASFDVGDAKLDEETSLNLEMGYHWHSEIEASVNLFYNRIDAFIYRRNTGAEDIEEGLPIFAYDQEDATFKGLEAELTLPLSTGWRLRLFGDSVRAELDRSGDVPRIPPARLGTELQFSADHWEAELRLTEVAEQNRPGEFEVKTDGYTNLETRLNYRINLHGLDYLIFLKGSNLLDEEIRNATSFLRDAAPAAGRNLQLGLRISF